MHVSCCGFFFLSFNFSFICGGLIFSPLSFLSTSVFTSENAHRTHIYIEKYAWRKFIWLQMADTEQTGSDTHAQHTVEIRKRRQQQQRCQHQTHIETTQYTQTYALHIHEQYSAMRSFTFSVVSHSLATCLSMPYACLCVCLLARLYACLLFPLVLLLLLTSPSFVVYFRQPHIPIGKYNTGLYSNSPTEMKKKKNEEEEKTTTTKSKNPTARCC